MKLAIIGTAGIPNNYGGFETLAEYLTKELNDKLSITVYCSSKNYDSKLFVHNGAKLVYLPIHANGIQSIFYDIISLFHAARKHKIILILGVSGCIILPLFRLIYSKTKLIVNIDGLEHRREKWKKPIKKFLKCSEKLAVKYSDIVVSDNQAIQEYVLTEYNIQSELIAYGGSHSSNVNPSEIVIEKYNMPGHYAFKVCRIEPENNVHLILEAFSEIGHPLVIIGNWNYSKYGKKLRNQYSGYNNIFLLDAIYDQLILNQIRSNCRIYIHGHSAGGTNPSLVEAMYMGLPVFAFDVQYNRATTKNKAKYFSSKTELAKLVSSISSDELLKIGFEMNNIAKKDYTWEVITKKYYDIIIS